jgi:hypothetical protein
VITGARTRQLDGTIAFLLFVGAAVGAGVHWRHTYAPHQPFYYQNYFEPAVMIGCGKGFVVARPQVPAMVPFLSRQIDRFSCDAIPPAAPLGTDDMFQQGSWRYLMLTVGYTWRIFGVSWSALGPLFALLFGASIVVLYGIFRLGMGSALAAAAALALCFSEYHLAYYSILRDYAKAPFTLALYFLLGALVAPQVASKRTVAIAAAYGAVAGIGYGFRPDFVADLPPLFIVLAVFLAGGVLANLRLKAAAAAACIAAFLMAAWPVISTQDRSRAGCQWHVVALGFANQFDRPLGVEPAPYEVSREYLDEWLYTTVTSYAARAHPGIGHIEFCEAGYGAATREYLTDIVGRFPADVIVRAYASVLRIVELPFTRRPGNDDPKPDAHWERYRAGLALVAVAVVVATAADVRIGLFMLFFLLYFGGLPAVQFDPRHFFHLEFVDWWAAGFLAQSAFARVRVPAKERGRLRAPSVRRAAIVMAGCLAVLVVTLLAARWYQQAAARALLAGYVAAPRQQVVLDQGPTVSPAAVRVANPTDPETADFISLDVDASRCGEHATAAFQYDPPRHAYSRVFDLRRSQESSGLTQIFMPVYDGFHHLEFSDAPPGCVVGVFRVRDVRQFPLLLEAVLRPGWRGAPLYQRIGGRVF